MTRVAEVSQLSVAFEHNQQRMPAIDGVDFELVAGETLALLGESGCGKSLTSLALMRLLPSNTSYGLSSRVTLSGQDLLALPERLMQQMRGRRLAMIFQEPMTALNPVLTIGDQLAESLVQHQTLSKTVLQSRMLQLLEEVEMPEPAMRLLQYPHQLSGGQKQRVMIAMALASNPEILIADEPTTALDVTIQAQILTLLKRLQQQHQMSMLLITHDLGVVKAVADRVCVMYAGQIVEYAEVQAFFSDPKHPYAQQLLIAMPSFEKRGRQLSIIQGQVPSLDNRPTGCRFHPRCAHVLEQCSRAEPAMQWIASHRGVRCHLYPTHQQPPSLVDARIAWPHVETAQELVFSVEHLKVYFSSPRRLQRHAHHFKAVDDLSFQLYKGKTLALVGESGCGKTTTVRAMLRLQPASSGVMTYRGNNILSLRGQALLSFRKKVQVIFQDPFSSMNPKMTVAEIIAEGLHAQHTPAKIIEKKLGQLLDQVNLPKNSLEKYPHQFSGGQRQRISIARALATEPELLICDEPTSALDVSVQAQILNLLKQLQQEYGLSYLFITHNMAVVSYIADDVLVMRAGKAVEKGSCEQVLMQPSHPYTQQLLASVLGTDVL